MKILKDKRFWLLAVITAIGFWLRLIFLNKPEGLWNDEYVSWSIASIPFGKDFFTGIISQCHMPLYYFYLKFFIHFWGSNDLLLRWTSVIPNIFAIIVMYFAGKEFCDEKTGILACSITSFSAFLIYFSQEVRFYSLLFLFSALLILYSLKLLKEQSKKNIVLFIISNILILLTHTIGFVFVFCNLLFVTLVLNKNTENKYKNILKNIWISIITITLICSPLIFKIFTSGGYSQWWSNFTSAKIMFMLTDFLSPVITNIVDSPTKFLTGITFAFIIFGIFPTIIAISAIINAILQKDYKVKILSATTVLAIIIVTVASMTGKLVFLTKYLIEIYPALILLVAFGFLNFNSKKVRKSLISIYIAFSLLYIIAFPTSAPKLHRGEGHKIVANLIKNAQLNKNDIVLINYYPQNRFEKYMSFNSYQVYSINKGNFGNYISKENNSTKIKKDGKKIYFNQFSKEDSNYFNKIFNSEILSKLKPNQKIAILNLTSVSIYSPMRLQMLTQNPHIYNKSPFLFMVFSYLRNEELKTCMQNLKITRIETKGNWELITFTK